MFIHAFTRIPARLTTKKYKSFSKRYYEFREEDTVRLCAWHHCEIHHLYTAVIERRVKKVRKHLFEFSWSQAESLMNELKELCLEWEKEETPGRNPALCNFTEDD